MQIAQIEFKDKTAFSPIFNDVYFNTENPLNERKHVFCIDEIFENQDHIIVAEIGFGAGLNFLNLVDKFLNTNKKLHYISIEAYPIKPLDIVKIYKNLGIFENLSQKLIKSYPPLKKGIYRINFTENIILDICFDDAKDMLKELDFKADVWFLDGFAPSKNPQIYTFENLKEISRLCKLNGILLSYSCARILKDSLTNAGFVYELKKGYKKRNMIKATLKKTYDYEKEIFFKRPEKYYGKRVFIIGSGISGLSCAYLFKKHGFDVKIASKDLDNASSNLGAILMPLITQKGVKLGYFHELAFYQAVNFYKDILPKNKIFEKSFIKNTFLKDLNFKNLNFFADFSGCLIYAYEKEILKRYENSNFELDYNSFPYPSIFIRSGANLMPFEILKFLKNDFEILNLDYESYEHINDSILINFKNNIQHECDILIFATGAQSRDIFQNLPLSSVRGQLSYVEFDKTPNFSFSAKSYVCKNINSLGVIGASYHRNDDDINPRQSDDIANLNGVSKFLKAKVISNRVSFRSYSSDRFPIIGPLFNETAFKKDYSKIFWTKKSNTAPKYEKNVFLNIAHGSRGFGTAILGANLLLDLVLNRPLCIPKSIYYEINPARFLIRKLKKNLI